MAFGVLSVKGRALRYLAQRDHSRLELERKLARRVEDTAQASAKVQIAAALDELAAHGLIDEARVAESVLASQAARFGSRHLQRTLQGKGLAADLVASTVQQARATDLERARALWARRFGTEAADATERARQMRFLAGRGFDGDVIRRVLRGTSDD